MFLSLHEIHWTKNEEIPNGKLHFLCSVSKNNIKDINDILMILKIDINDIKDFRISTLYENKVYSYFVDKLKFRCYVRLEVFDG